MRICHVISGDLWAGAEMMCLRLLTGLGENKGVELSAILMNDGKLAQEIQNQGIPVHVVDETRLNIFQTYNKFNEVLMKFNPDIVHTHRLKENVLGFLASRNAGRGLPLICTQHGLDEPQSRLKWKLLSGANRYILSRYFRNVVAVSEDMRVTLLEKYRYPPHKVVVIHNGTEVRDGIHPQQGNRPFTIGSAGRLFPVKDYPFLVEVAAEIHRHARDVRFELAGEGPEFDKVLEHIAGFGLQDVFSLKGFVENMESFYNGLDLYISTSLHEGFPMSVLEAMSHGLPVVAPLVGGVKEAVTNGVEGFLIDGRDPKPFAQKSLQIYQDPVLRNTMGAASRERVIQEFSIKTMAGKYYELYKKVLSQPERAGLS
jgi:L-malate glycosyltransferase